MNAPETELAKATGPSVLPPEAYELRIRATHGLVTIDWRELWQYRDLLGLLIRRDFVSKYTQTVLGPIWFLVQPLVTTFVFTVIFGKVARIPTDGLPPMLFYLCGMLGWSYFANTFASTSATFLTNAGLFGKVYFPRLVVPISSTVSNIFALGIQLLSFLAFWVYFKFFTDVGHTFAAQWTVFAFPLLVLHIGALALAVGLWMSVLTAKYRDLMQLSGFLLQLWMYATPVILPLSLIPDRWRWAMMLNPMTMPVETLRYMFLGKGYFTLAYVLVSAVMTLVLLVSGLAMFQRVERTFVDAV